MIQATQTAAIHWLSLSNTSPFLDNGQSIRLPLQQTLARAIVGGKGSIGIRRIFTGCSITAKHIHAGKQSCLKGGSPAFYTHFSKVSPTIRSGRITSGSFVHCVIYSSCFSERNPRQQELWLRSGQKDCAVVSGTSLPVSSSSLHAQQQATLSMAVFWTCYINSKLFSALVVPAGLLSFICPCIQFGRNAEAMGENCLHYGLSQLVPLLDLYCRATMRGKIRDKQGIEGTCLKDLLCVWCCGPCSLAQEAQVSCLNTKNKLDCVSYIAEYQIRPTYKIILFICLSFGRAEGWIINLWSELTHLHIVSGSCPQELQAPGGQSMSQE